MADLNQIKLAGPAGLVSLIAGVTVSFIVGVLVAIIMGYSDVVFGGLLGTTSGVTAGLAATDAKLVPYGALTATFYTGLGCLICPSVFYLTIKMIFNF